MTYLTVYHKRRLICDVVCCKIISRRGRLPGEDYDGLKRMLEEKPDHEVSKTFDEADFLIKICRQLHKLYKTYKFIKLNTKYKYI